jgi:hypothetical protein
MCSLSGFGERRVPTFNRQMTIGALRPTSRAMYLQSAP